MVRNLSLDEGPPSPEAELFVLLNKQDPAKVQAMKKLKKLLLTAGFSFGVIVFLILIQDPEPDYLFATFVGVGIAVLGGGMEFLIWKILVKSMLKKLKTKTLEKS